MGSGIKMRPWIETMTCMRLEWVESHFSELSPPCHVPSRLRHTLPSAYRLGLNLRRRRRRRMHKEEENEEQEEGKEE